MLITNLFKIPNLSALATIAPLMLKKRYIKLATDYYQLQMDWNKQQLLMDEKDSMVSDQRTIILNHANIINKIPGNRYQVDLLTGAVRSLQSFTNTMIYLLDNQNFSYYLTNHGFRNKREASKHFKSKTAYELYMNSEDQPPFIRVSDKGDSSVHIMEGSEEEFVTWYMQANTEIDKGNLVKKAYVYTLTLNTHLVPEDHPEKDVADKYHGSTYVGKTIQEGPDKRWKSHFFDSNTNGYTLKDILFRAFDKEHFDVTIKDYKNIYERDLSICEEVAIHALDDKFVLNNQ